MSYLPKCTNAFILWWAEREAHMQTKDRQIYGEVNSKTGLQNVFVDIRHDVDKAKSRATLTELYKRAGYLVTLTHAPSWQQKFGRKAPTLRKVGEEEFARTARKVNQRAEKIGAKANYDEKWGNGKK
jgi:hypothetical protein